VVFKDCGNTVFTLEYSRQLFKLLALIQACRTALSCRWM